MGKTRAISRNLLRLRFRLVYFNRLLEPIVRAEVAAEYAERLNAAGIWQRFWLIREMKREIAKRVEQKAPFDALY